MKFLILSCILYLTVLSSLESKKICRRKSCPKIKPPCKNGTYLYSTGCDYKTPEPTCYEPYPKVDKKSGKIRDYSQCRCKPPTVRDETTGRCVVLEDCPPYYDCVKRTHRPKDEY